MRNKEVFPCVRPWNLLSASPRTVYFQWCRSLTTLTTLHRTSKVVENGEARDSNETEMGRRGSRVADGEVYEG